MAGQSLFGVVALHVCLFLIFASISAAKPCYYPDGNVSNDVPCTNSSVSACCGIDAICLTNGLCLTPNPPYGLSRGSCTDSGWKSDNCPQYCTKKEPRQGSRISVFNSSVTPYTYCCGPLAVRNGNITCERNVGNVIQHPFHIPGSTSSVIPGAGALKGLEKTSNSSTLIATNVTCPRPSNSATSTPNPSTSSSARDATIGAGVGVPLGVIAVLSIAWALWERRKRHQATKADQQNGGYQKAPFRELPGCQPEAVELGDTSLPPTSNADESQSAVGTHSFISRSNPDSYYSHRG